MSNPYLAGGFAPVQHEYTLTDLAVTGAIPDHLDGRYLRNGPNPRQATAHWFTGDGMIHGVRIESGRAKWYRNPVKWYKQQRYLKKLTKQMDNTRSIIRIESSPVGKNHFKDIWDGTVEEP